MPGAGVSLEEAFLGEAYSAEQRRAMADRGEAMADGSFPIGTLEDLKKAIALRNNGNGDRSAIYAHIRKRAEALGGESLLPEELRESDGGAVPVGVAERQGNLAGPAQRHGPYQGVADPARNIPQGIPGGPAQGHINSDKFGRLASTRAGKGVQASHPAPFVKGAV